MKATARGRTFEDVSWNGLVSRIVSVYRLSTTASQRTQAARDLEDGYATTIAGIRIEVTH